MSVLWISIVTFGLVLATIAILWVILQLCKYEQIVWKIGLLTCMVLLGAGTILIFIPDYSKYAAMTRMFGLFSMVSAVCYVRYQKSDGWEMERVKRSDYLIRAGAALLIAGFIGTPFFSVLNTQQQVKTSQISIVGLLLRIETAINKLNDNLDREHEERLAIESRDSTERKQIMIVLVATKAQLDVNSKFLRAPSVVQRGPVLNITQPQSRTALPANIPTSVPNHVKDVPVVVPGKKSSRKYSYEPPPPAWPDWELIDSLQLAADRRKKRE